MSHFGCPCGNRIQDNTDFLPYKAEFYPDQHSEMWSEMSALIAGFMESAMRGERTAWIKNYFLPDYSLTLDNQSVILDIMNSVTLKYAKPMYECVKCGRVLLPQNNGDPEFTTFVSESGHYQGVLRSFTASPTTPSNPTMKQIPSRSA